MAILVHQTIAKRAYTIVKALNVRFQRTISQKEGYMYCTCTIRNWTWIDKDLEACEEASDLALFLAAQVGFHTHTLSTSNSMAVLVSS